MKKLYDFYCSVEAIHHESKQCRPVMRLVDGKTYNEYVETGKKPISEWGDLVMVVQAVDMTHVTINGVKQGEIAETNQREEGSPLWFGVHQSHCCKKHGCKYGEENCPVANGSVKQDTPCERCGTDDEDIDAATISDLRIELKSVQKDNETLRRQIADMLQKGAGKS